MKKFIKSQWKKMQVFAEANEKRAQIRVDYNGDLWIWKSAGKYVWAARFINSF